jgi:ABC-type Co2+ transport system permease subunit
MGTAAVAASYLNKLLPKGMKYPAAFVAAFVAVRAAAALVALALWSSGGELALTARLILAANLPLAAVEGVITVFMLLFLSKLMPGGAALP